MFLFLATQLRHSAYGTLSLTNKISSLPQQHQEAPPPTDSLCLSDSLSVATQASALTAQQLENTHGIKI